MAKVSQVELNSIYLDVLNDHKTGMIHQDYFITKYTKRDDELIFRFDQTMPLGGRWIVKTEIDLLEDEPD